ncbi:TetR/AcrR family transcriptional regulator [Baekduia sp. Peel2402]|uniref:TetR/AcrR family transcriptional regulator n=1 Tax=Baekduia sp. Peel2402 TaxID=3458296 RepID=UPI00403E95BD
MGTTADHKPLRADAERNRRRILEAAAEVFGERGLGATLDAVAERAGVGVGTVYRRFPDKESLVDALFEERIEEIRAIAHEAAEIPDGWDALTTFMERALEMHCHDRALKELVFSTAHGQDRVARARERIKPAVDALFERARASGKLRDDVVTTDLPIVQLMITAVMDYAQDASPEIWRRYLTLMLDGLRADGQRTPLAPAPLTDDQLDGVMARGFHTARR